MTEGQQESPGVVWFVIAYIHWRPEFAVFEAEHFDALCGLVRELLRPLDGPLLWRGL